MDWQNMTTRNDRTYAEVWCLEFDIRQDDWVSVGRRHDGIYETWNCYSSDDTILPVINMDDAKAMALMLYKMR